MPYDEQEIPLLDAKDVEKSPVIPEIKHSRIRLPSSSILWLIILVQFIIIVYKTVAPIPTTTEQWFQSQILYSPAQGEIEYEIRTFDFGIPGAESPYQMSLSPELDKKWEALYNEIAISRIPKHEANLLPNKTVGIPGDNDHYIVALDVFHQLHCLNYLRKALYPKYYTNISRDDPEVEIHLDHCVDSIRQSLMCSSDISVLVWQWDKRFNSSGFKGNVAHTCRNFEKIHTWAKERTLLEEFNATVHVEYNDTT